MVPSEALNADCAKALHATCDYVLARPETVDAIDLSFPICSISEFRLNVGLRVERDLPGHRREPTDNVIYGNENRNEKQKTMPTVYSIVFTYFFGYACSTLYISALWT